MVFLKHGVNHNLKPCRTLQVIFENILVKKLKTKTNFVGQNKFKVIPLKKQPFELTATEFKENQHN